MITTLDGLIVVVGYFSYISRVDELANPVVIRLRRDPHDQ